MINRTDEIRQRCEAGRTVRITDVKYLLGEIDLLTEAHEAMLRDLQMRAAQVEALERERDAAVEDLKTMALAMRESDELEVGCCFACKFDASNNDNMEPWNECPGFNTDNCFEWRGPHEAEKEDSNE